MAYTRKQIEDLIEEQIINPLINIDEFYRAPFNNYIGKTSDKGKDEYYSEIIASEILKIPSFFDGIKLITRESKSKSYYTASHHNGTIPINKNSNRHEENFSKKLYKEGFNNNPVGKIIDFQVSLKDEQSDKVGKIDLMSFNDSTSTLYLIELKYGDNQETLLRAILEVHTYIKIINLKKLKRDNMSLFSKSVNINDVVIKPAVMVVKDPKKIDCKSFIELEELEKGKRVNLKKLAKELEITFFKSADGETFEMIKF